MFVKQEYHEVRTDYSCYTRQLTDLLQIFASILNDFGEGRVRFTYNEFVEVMTVIHRCEVSLFFLGRAIHRFQSTGGLRADPALDDWTEDLPLPQSEFLLSYCYYKAACALYANRPLGRETELFRGISKTSASFF